MRRCYFDASAAAKLLVQEAESADVMRWADDEDLEAVSSLLMETELRRMAERRGLTQESVSAVLRKFALFEIPPWEYRAAGLIPGDDLRTLDALHVASAIRVEADVLVTYDARMRDAAAAMGLAVVQPGR